LRERKVQIPLRNHGGSGSFRDSTATSIFSWGLPYGYDGWAVLAAKNPPRSSHRIYRASAAFGLDTVVYLPIEHIRQPELAWVDRDGKVTPVPGGRGPIISIALSPNGREAAGALLGDGTRSQIWIFDVERGARRLLVAEGHNLFPIWSRDGAFVTYMSVRGQSHNLYRKRADGTGAEQLLARRSRWPTPEDWSPDGRTLLFSEYTSRGDADIWTYSAGKVTPLIASPFHEAAAKFSPDGRFIAFHADDGGLSRVYLQSFPGPGPRTTVSDEEGGWSRWRADGRELTYWRGERLMVVAVQTDPVLRIGRPQMVLESRGGRHGYAGVAPGGRVLTLSSRTTEGPPELRIILNWFEELERLAPHPRR
jgi:Tol biopolymer transport system component